MYECFNNLFGGNSNGFFSERVLNEIQSSEDLEATIKPQKQEK